MQEFKLASSIRIVKATPERERDGEMEELEAEMYAASEFSSNSTNSSLLGYRHFYGCLGSQ